MKIKKLLAVILVGVSTFCVTSIGCPLEPKKDTALTSFVEINILQGKYKVDINEWLTEMEIYEIDEIAQMRVDTIEECMQELPTYIEGMKNSKNKEEYHNYSESYYGTLDYIYSVIAVSGL